MRAVVELNGQKDVSRAMIAESEVQVLARDHVPKAGFPSSVPAGDEIGESDLESDEVAAADCRSEGEVESSLAAAQKTTSRFIR